MTQEEKKLHLTTYGSNLMTIELSPEKREELQAVLKAFVLEEFDEDIGDLKSSIMLDHLVEHLGPAIYNKALHDMQTHISVRVDDVVDSLFKQDPG